MLFKKAEGESSFFDNQNHDKRMSFDAVLSISMVILW